MARSNSIHCPKCEREIILTIAADQTDTPVICCGVLILISMPRQIVGKEIQTRFLTNERYQNLEYRGQGMNAIVLSARDKRLDRRVALKVTKFAQRMDVLLQEESAKKIAKLNHPNIPIVYELDYFYDLITGQKVDVVVMEYIDGITLNIVSPSQFFDGTYDPLTFFWSLCATLEYCHNLGYYHGDLISLANIMISMDSQAWLIDFGYSRQLDSERKPIFDLRSSDLEALVKIANLVFGVELEKQVTGEESLYSVLKTIERAIRSEEGQYTYARTFTKRYEFVKKQRRPLSPYRIIEERIFMTIHSHSSADYIITTEIDAFEPLSELRQILFFDWPVDYIELRTQAQIEINGKSSNVQIQLEDQKKEENDIIFNLIFRMPAPKEGFQRLRFSFSHPQTMNPNKDEYSQDIYTYCQRLVMQFRFPETDLPHPWVAYIQQYGERSEKVDGDDWLSINSTEKLVTCTFLDLRQYEAIHIQYGLH